MNGAPGCITGLLLLCLLLYVVWHVLVGTQYDEDDDPAGYYDRLPPPRRRVVQFADNEPEYFDGPPPPPPPPPPQPTTAAAAPAASTMQSALDFSDVLVGEEQRTATATIEAGSEQIQTVNERFDAAKRGVTENRMRQGVYDNKERRRLVEALLRRPACGRRVRSWRTENSDTLRGDPVPKNTSSWGMLRAGRSNPLIDLHPGALGPMSGLQGMWLQAESMADNAFADLPPLGAP